MEQMKPRDPAKAKVDKVLDEFLGMLIDTKDQFVAFKWETDHYEIMTKSGKLYFVDTKKWNLQ